MEIFDIIEIIKHKREGSKMEDNPESKNEMIEDDGSSEEIPVNRVKAEDSFETEEDELERLSAEAQDDFGDSAEDDTTDASEKKPAMEPEAPARRPVAPVEEPVVNRVSLEETMAESYSGREHVYKNGAFYAFRYIIALLTGAGFIASLIAIISITISKLVDEDFLVSAYAGSYYANAMTAVVILGLIHLFVSLTVGANWKPEDGKKRRYPVALSVIYSVGLGAAAIIYLVTFLGTLFGSLLGLNDIKAVDIFEQFLSSLVAIIILVFALSYKLDLFKRMQKAIYVFVMGVIAVAGVTLFLIFPAQDVRNAMHDDKVIEDLEMIEDSISDYYYDNGYKLPRTLSDLKLGGDDVLNYGLSQYAYSAYENKKRGGSMNDFYANEGSYKICAVFNASTKSDDDLGYYRYDSYYYHDKGENCFERSVYGSYIYDDYYNDYYDDDDDHDYSWLDLKEEEGEESAEKEEQEDSDSTDVVEFDIESLFKNESKAETAE